MADWRPGATQAVLRARAAMLAEIRAFFAARGVLEVETPLAVAMAATDPQIEPLTTTFTGPGHPDGIRLYLQTSPEHAMKRLLAAGSGPIYQVCKAFRDGEAGRRHNPEFTLLEWYRPGWGHNRLMEEVAELARVLLGRKGLVSRVYRYAGLFEDALGIDVFDFDAPALARVARRQAILGAEQLDLDRDGWLDLLFTHLIERSLGANELAFVTDYPASQAALARIGADPRVAARFELYHRGMELANGYHELSDPAEQSARFEADNCARRGRGQDGIRVDHQLLGALEQGLPDSSGVALGLDRMLMLRTGMDDIDAVLAFSLARST